MVVLKLLIRIIKNLSPQSILVLSFVIVIIIGSILLKQSFALNGNHISYVDALFTSASATCVTGLIVVDTGSFFSIHGQLIILFLIQLGGIGVMSFSVLFLFFFRGKFGIGSRELIQETIAFFNTVDIGALLKSVFIFTFIIESIGAFLLTFRFLFDMPIKEAIFSGIFHSISAFCNAGFSLNSDSLMKYTDDIYVNIVVSLLILIGGIGFIVIYEIKNLSFKNFSIKKLSLHSRVALKFSFILILAGAIFIFVFEYNVSMKDMTLDGKILSSIFQSITARTAGFNTIDIYRLSMPSLFFLINLMFIGASPASTGGGVKTTTIIVLISYVISRIKDAKFVNIGFNTLPNSIISKAIVIVVFSISIIVSSSFLLTILELQNAHFGSNSERFVQIFFEAVSAFCTVGLSTGITADFSFGGKFVLIFLMLAGRVGPLTIATAIGSKESQVIKYAEDNLLVG